VLSEVKNDVVMEAQRQRVADLLRAGLTSGQIVDIVGCGLTTVKKVKKLLSEGQSLQRKAGSGGHNKKLTDEFLADLATEIEANPTNSMRKTAKALNISEKSIRTAVRMLGAHSYVRRRRQLLTKKTKEARLARGKKLLNFLKKKDSSTVLVFSDKKNWTVDQSRNARNDRYLAYSVEEVPPINQTKHPASAMMLGVVASDGRRMPPFWFPKGLRVGSKEYLDVLKSAVKPWLDANYPDGNYVWQQDGAPGHKAIVAQNWCKEHLAQFWPSDWWPPSSPDLSPLDYGIWGYVESKACATPHASVEALKSSIEKEWTDMSMDYVIKVCKAFRPRLEAMIEAEGGHFEK